MRMTLALKLSHSLPVALLFPSKFFVLHLPSGPILVEQNKLVFLSGLSRWVLTDPDTVQRMPKLTLQGPQRLP